MNQRKAIGIELKTSYYNQAVKNIEFAMAGGIDKGVQTLFEFNEPILEMDQIEVSENQGQSSD